MKLHHLILGIATAGSVTVRVGPATDHHKIQPCCAVDTRRNKASSSSPSGLRTEPRARSKWRSIPTAPCTRTRKRNGKLCNSVAVQMLAPPWPSSARSAPRNSRWFDFPYIFEDLLICISDPRHDWRQPAGQSLSPRASRGWLWDNGFQILFGKYADQNPGGSQGQEDAHPVVEGTRRGDSFGGWHPAGHGILRGLPSLQNRRRGWH